MKWFPFFLLLILNFSTDNCLAQISTIGLKAYYPFNGNANDASGNGNHGVVSGATLTTDRFGVGGAAYSFDGINDVITINHQVGFNFTNYTISLWFKYNGLGPAGKAIWTIISKNSSGSGNQDPFQIWMVASNKNPGGRVGDGSVNIEYSNPPATNDGAWHQAVIVFDNPANQLRQYIDGMLISTNTFNGNPFVNSDAINIGNWAAYGNYFNGAIDDIRLYNRAFSQEEVSNLYQVENPINNYSFMTVRCFMQGYYNGTNSLKNVLYNQGIDNLASNRVDTVTISLRSSLYPFTKVYSHKSVLQTNGNMPLGFPTLLPAGNYRIAIEHRNALESWSAFPGNSIVAGSTYNFTTGANQSSGYMKEMSAGIWAFYCGDINRDGNIDLIDFPPLELDMLNFSSGYLATDLNGDGNVDLMDYAILELNNLDFIFFSEQ